MIRHKNVKMLSFIDLYDIMIDFVFVGLKDISHGAAHCEILSRPLLRQLAAATGLSTIIKRLTSVNSK